MRPAIFSGVIFWLGATLVLSEIRWFARRPLVDRLRPYAVSAQPAPSSPGLLSFESFREVIGPLSRAAGERLSRALGVTEDLSDRLARIHSPYDVTTFRIRQAGGSLVGLLAAGAIEALVRPPLPLAVAALAGAPLLGFLVLEQQVSSASAAWQRRLFLELPVISEQLAMLLSAGYSLGSALNRLGQRGHGACARDLRRVMSRVQQGLSEVDALREWGALARIPAIDRLIPVLALHSEAADLGRLISEEARSIRRDVQRELIETLEKRSQSVWIPVTVAALIPGVILLAIPFAQALQLFTTG